MSELRQLIREVLAEELARLPDQTQPPRVIEERVTISSDADLAAFVSRLMTAAQDDILRRDIAEGRVVFRLQESTPQPVDRVPPEMPGARFEGGLVTERDLASLARDATRVSVGKTVRFTPLARDELRRRGIRIERTSS